MHYTARMVGDAWSTRLTAAAREVSARCPRLVRSCYWAGTSAIALEELRHRESFDLDFHTRRALADVRPILQEVAVVFRPRIAVIQAPDENGSGFRVALDLPDGGRLPMEVLSNFRSVAGRDLVASTVVPGLRRIALAPYLDDKVQCVVERQEARDLFDIAARRARALLLGWVRGAQR